MCAACCGIIAVDDLELKVRSLLLSWLHRLHLIAIIVSGHSSKSTHLTRARDLPSLAYALFCFVCVCLKIESDENKIAC